MPSLIWHDDHTEDGKQANRRLLKQLDHWIGANDRAALLEALQDWPPPTLWQHSPACVLPVHA